VVGVAEQDAGAGVAELLGRETLNGALGSHGHVNRGVSAAEEGVEAAQAGQAIGVQKVEMHRHCSFFIFHCSLFILHSTAPPK
jgi:hypothetical protein